MQGSDVGLSQLKLIHTKQFAKALSLFEAQVSIFQDYLLYVQAISDNVFFPRHLKNLSLEVLDLTRQKNYYFFSFGGIH